MQVSGCEIYYSICVRKALGSVGDRLTAELLTMTRILATKRHSEESNVYDFHSVVHRGLLFTRSGSMQAKR